LVDSGKSDDTLERAFSAVESRLPKTLKQLEEAAYNAFTHLPSDIYENMCRYCACLKNIGLFAKPDALVGFVIQANMELETGEYALLRDFNIPERTLASWRKEYALGSRVIVEAENTLQLLYTLQFKRWYERDYGMFRNVAWTICKSPIELPISDVGLVATVCKNVEAIIYLLPVGPNLVLKGLQHFDPAKNSTREGVNGIELKREQADCIFDIICSSAVTEVVSTRQNERIAQSVGKAKQNGVTFPEVVNPEAVTSAGLKNSTDQLCFRLVALDEYKRFVRSHVRPPVPNP
jgi:hypothetical protein